MLMRGVALLILAGLGTAAARPEKVEWEAVSITLTGDRTVIAGGTKQYSPLTDVVVEQQTGPKGDETWWSNSLPLDDRFVLSAVVNRAPKLNGFRLAISRRGDPGFSWELFQRVEGSVFTKRQGSGSVSVGVKKGPDYEELESVEFLDDIVLRYSDGRSNPSGAHTPTQEITIRKGSVFRWAQQAP